MIQFIERPDCDVCGAANPQTMIDALFTDPSVSDFLVSFHHSRIPLDRFPQDARFVVVQCRQCGFAWQRFVLDDAGMEELYERWIVPVQSLRKRVSAPPSYKDGLRKDGNDVTVGFSDPDFL